MAPTLVLVCVLVPGIIISIARIITKIVLPDTGAGLRISAAVYFALSSIFLLLCVLGCEYLHKLPIMEFYERRKGQSESLLVVDRLPSDGDLKPATLKPAGAKKWLFSCKVFTVEGNALALQSSGAADYWKVFLKVWPCATTLWLVYIVTLSIFPGTLRSFSSNDDNGTPSHLLAVFYMTNHTLL